MSRRKAVSPRAAVFVFFARFEYLVLSSSTAAACPSCQKSDLKQLISLSPMSSETTRDASFNSAHHKAAAARKDKKSEEHGHLHEHFED